MNFFTSSQDLNDWVLRQGEPNLATQRIVEVIGNQDALSIKDGCFAIFDANKKEEKDEDFSNEIEESEGLFSVLSKYNITEMTKTSEVNLMNKKIEKFNQTFPIREAQVTRPPSSPYTGREDDNKYVGTPWRRDRDAIYDFTHRNPDMLSFDDDPHRVYSGEALWRRYVMDKFYRDYKDEKGRVVGGFINDRFKVFHDLGGNQMELATGERTRKPRPHQYSIERRLEEARGQKTEDILPLRAASGAVRVIITGSEEKPAKPSDIRYVSSTDEGYVKISSKDAYKEEEDDIAKAFVDILDMHEAGVGDKEIILKVSNHYRIPIARVAQIKAFAYDKLHSAKGVLYACDNSKMKKTALVNPLGVRLEQNQEFINMSTGKSENLGHDVRLKEQGSIKGQRVFIEDNEENQANDGATATRYTLPRGVSLDAENIEENMEEISNSMRELEGEDPMEAVQENTTPVPTEVAEQVEAEPMEAAASNDFPIKEV